TRSAEQLLLLRGRHDRDERDRTAGVLDEPAREPQQVVGHAGDRRGVEQLAVVFEVAAQPRVVVKQLERELCPRGSEIDLDPVGRQVLQRERGTLFAREQRLRNRRQAQRLDQILVRLVVSLGGATDFSRATQAI